MSKPQPFVASKWHFAELQLAKTATLANLQTNGLKGSTMTKTKVMSFCVSSSSTTALDGKLC